MGDLPKGASEPTGGGADMGYTLIEGEKTKYPISCVKADLLVGDEEALEHKHNRRGPGNQFACNEEHQGPERLG